MWAVWQIVKYSFGAPFHYLWQFMVAQFFFMMIKMPMGSLFFFQWGLTKKKLVYPQVVKSHSSLTYIGTSVLSGLVTSQGTGIFITCRWQISLAMFWYQYGKNRTSHEPSMHHFKRHTASVTGVPGNICHKLIWCLGLCFWVGCMLWCSGRTCRFECSLDRASELLGEWNLHEGITSSVLSMFFLWLHYLAAAQTCS